jgi:hypothetical protein
MDLNRFSRLVFVPQEMDPSVVNREKIFAPDFRFLFLTSFFTQKVPLVLG